MLYQVTAFDLLGGLQMQVTTSETVDGRMAWEHRVLELVHPPSALRGDPWDMLWVLAVTLEERARERGAGLPL